jgi:hypothetical protein
MGRCDLPENKRVSPHFEGPLEERKVEKREMCQNGLASIEK